MVSYARSTYEKAKKFNEKLQELQKTIKPIVIRTYLASKAEGIEAKLNLSQEEITQIEELQEIRKSGIQAEMKYALAQAKENGVELSEQIISGDAIEFGLSKEMLQKAPSLGVYNLFMLFTKEEIEELMNKDDEEYDM